MPSNFFFRTGRSAFLDGFYSADEELMIERIILEEVSPFFSGEKRLDEVVGIIQSRAQLYLDEGN